MSSIRALDAYPVLSSNGMPTLEVRVTLQSGVTAHAAAPKGQSCGIFERSELRDEDGLRVSKALRIFEYTVAPAIIGRDSAEHLAVDRMLLEMRHDGKPIPSNVTLPISIALALAHSQEVQQPLEHYIGGIAHKGPEPIPCINMINGGIHGKNPLVFQEYLIVPQGASSFSQSITWAIDICEQLKRILSKKGLFSGVGDEGGFCVNTDDPTAPLDLLAEAIHAAKLNSQQVALGIDCAASGYRTAPGIYENFPGIPGQKEAPAVRDLLLKIAQNYELAYIEDPFAEDDVSAWQSFDVEAHIIGDDLFATNLKRLSTLAHQTAANGIMIKPNQVGTLMHTIETVQHARLLGYNTVFAHRSADTEDTWIASLALGFQADLIKFGNIVRAERTAKYNTLLRAFNIRNL